MKNEVYLIGCHVENPEQERLLRRLVEHLHFFKKDFVLVSHTFLPSDIIAKSVGFIFDKCNPTFNRWELPDAPHFNFYCPKFRISSKYILYGACLYYHVGVLRLLINGINYLKTLDYKIIHWIEYDMFPDFDRAQSNERLIKEGKNFVFHGLGSFFSLDAKVKTKYENNLLNNKYILEMLRNNSYVAELVIMNDLFDCEPTKIFDVLSNSGDYSQNFDSVKIHWCLFQKEDKTLNVFLLNKQNRNIHVKFTMNEIDIVKNMLPEMYHLNTLGMNNLKENNKIKIEVEGDECVNINMNKEDIIKYLIQDTIFIQNV